MTQQQQPVKQWPTQKGEVAVYKARAMPPGPDGYSPHQFGENERTKTLELLVRLNVPEMGRTVTTPLYFSGDAAPYSWERLRALGKEDDDITHLRGIDKNEVDIEVRVTDYEGKLQVKVQILTGGGNFNSSSPLDPKSFAAKLQALTGKGMNAGNGSGGAPPPPF